MRFSRRIFPIAFSVMMITLCPRATHAVDTWEAAASELARKIVAHAPPRARMTLDVQNRSSLTEDEVTSIARAIRTALREQGARLAATGRPQAQVVVTISENLQSLVWVAQIVPTESAPEESSRDVEMVEVARSQTASPPASSPTMVIHQELLFEQSEPILDLVMLQSVDDSAPRMLLLDKNDVVLYAKEGGVWTVAQSAPLARSRPWPRDPRGRLVAQPDGGFTVFTPGTRCQGTISPDFTMKCRANDDPWPINPAGPNQMSAEFVSDRNYFSGKVALTGKILQEPMFFSTAAVPSAGGPLLALAGLDGQARVFGRKPKPLSVNDDWGSDIVAVESGCASGWQILATRAGNLEQSDAVQAWSLRDGTPVEASAPLDFPGPVTALWPAASGGALAVVRDRATEKYEAFTLSISCGQ
jgi:hypothetical protein